MKIMGRRTKTKAIPLLAGMLLMTAATASAGLPSYDMEEIIVTAQTVEGPIVRESVNAKYVSPGKAATIPELLRQTTGIDISMRTVYGDNQDGTVKLRGFDARRYTVLLDGRQINAAGVMGGQYIDWNSIPLATVEKIQIIKGAKTAEHGNTLGGTINIVTKKDAAGGTLSLLAGEQGRYEYRFHYGAQADKLNLQVTAGKVGADAFLRNNHYDADQYGLRLNYEAGARDSFIAGYQRTKAERGFIIPNRPELADFSPAWPTADGDSLSPAAPFSLRDGSYWEKDNKYYDFSYRRKNNAGFWQVDYYRNDETRREVVKNDDGSVVLDRLIPSDKSDYLGGKGETNLGNHTYSYGLEQKKLRYGYGFYNVGTGTPIYPSQKIDLFGAYIADTWAIDERWSAYLGLRYDKFKGSKDAPQSAAMRDYDTDSLSPKLNLSLRNDEKTTTFLSVNRVWRAPSMAEYYWWSQNYSNAAIGGNPNPTYNTQLKPEKGTSYELAATHAFSGAYKSKLTVYYEDLADYINFRHTWPFLAYNIDSAKIWGWEWENEYKLNKNSSVLVNYTNQHTKKSGVLSYDKIGLSGELDYSPRHKVGIAYLYDKDDWNLRYSVNYVSSQQEALSGAVKKIGGYTVHNLGITRALTEQSEVALYVDNLFDKEYAQQYGYPMSGRLTSVVYTQKF